DFVTHVDASKIDVAAAKGQDSLPLFNAYLVNPSALFFFFRVAGIENDSVSAFKRALQSDNNALAFNSENLSEVNATLFAEPPMHQLLIVNAAQPTGVEAARESHFHVVTGDRGRVARDRWFGLEQVVERFPINASD